MESLSVILGAGFSKSAGLPLGSEINDYFDRDNRENLLCFSSGEVFWKDGRNETDVNNGTISFDYLIWGYILNSFVKHFKEENGSFENYELFYQFVFDSLYKNKSYKTICADAKEEFIKDRRIRKENPRSKYILNRIENPIQRLVMSMLNHLISDLLGFSTTNLVDIYTPFINYTSHFDSIDIFTLNHDLLLECILHDYFNIDFSDGFSKNNSEIINDKGEQLLTFQDEFGDNLNLIKLHGSRDTYKFNIGIQKNNVITPTGEFIYFKTLNYHDKHIQKRINPQNGEVIQTLNAEFAPMFITGTNKEELIQNDYMYSSLYKRLEERILLNNHLLIVGYSFRDDHINEQIKEVLLDKNLKSIINVNRSTEFPYDFDQITNLDDISKLA